ncbi:ABC transporter substrate-binding protein [Actibacterium mucosum KCTC 23349]|uniref:ABC transporter substrate-binding protein n=1 Tax=Actibacterium mucosum KCTC 23349 TaxID=1454373 RepID=A0A037ZFP2_9RHOB|nr:extracellular solute-binding protein [Actibacterium mucosum]KAJ54398.1 ABC transporter substrate-binding protein [Actibacterium mucosum KCTC 23349]
MSSIKLSATTKTAIAAAAVAFAGPVSAAELTFICYNNNVECETFEELAKGWTAETGHTLDMEVVAYQVIREQLLTQVEGGQSPDLFRITDVGGFAPYLLDLSPYIDRAYWEENYSNVLGRATMVTGDNGIYHWPTLLSMTGPFVNLTMFEDAGVDLPGDGATWEDWAEALRTVKDELGLTAGLCMDRTTHRWAGPAISYGAALQENGEPILVDDGFRAFSELFVGWHAEGLMPQEGWPAGAGTQYRNCAPQFLDGTVAMHQSGSWMIGNYAENITDFEWAAVPAPCGPAGCGAIPGGASLAGYKGSEHPEAVASFIDYMAREENAEAIAIATSSISGHQGLQKTGVDYSSLDPKIGQALSVFSGNAAGAPEAAWWLSAYPQNFAIYGIVPDYLTQAINGEISLDDALAAIDADVKAKAAE